MCLRAGGCRGREQAVWFFPKTVKLVFAASIRSVGSDQGSPGSDKRWTSEYRSGLERTPWPHWFIPWPTTVKLAAKLGLATN